MKFISNILGFDNATYHDPAGQSSAGRKALVGALVALIALIFVCVGIAVYIDPKQAASVHTFYTTGLTVLASIVTAAFAFVYGGKAYTQANEAKAKAAATTPATTPPTPPKKPPQAPPMADSVAKTDAAAAAAKAPS